MSRIVGSRGRGGVGAGRNVCQSVTCPKQHPWYKFYKDRFSYQLDLYLNNDDILDLRAGYYDKFYKSNKPYTTLKFLKAGKTVSHWAKAYRGLVLRALAKNNINSMQEFKSLEIQGLNVKEIKVIKNKTEIVYDITQE